MDGIDGVIKQVDVWFQQVEKTAKKDLHKHVASLFYTILETTPQGSGRAVANWKIGINSPDTTFETDVGDAPEIVDRKDGSGSYVSWAHRKKGDHKWIDYAWELQRYKIRQLKVGDVVYITNNVQGDTDGGRSDANYLASLQDPAYWAAKLREVNQPYIRPAEVLLMHQQNWDTYADFGSNLAEQIE